MITISHTRNGKVVSTRQWESQEAMQRDLGQSSAPLTLTQKFQRLTSELRRWKSAGYKLAPRAERKRRAALCQACPAWNPAGNWGLGECRRCGCTAAKVWLATTSCPLHPSKWTALQGPGNAVAKPLQPG